MTKRVLRKFEKKVGSKLVDVKFTDLKTGDVFRIKRKNGRFGKVVGHSYSRILKGIGRVNEIQVDFI